MTTATASIPSILTARFTRRHLAMSALLVIGASLLIALAAQVAIDVPFSPVPLTLQPLAVLLVGVTLGARRGAAAAAVYLLEGACGLPVFAQAHGGAIWLAAPTAGYLWSYPMAAFIAGWFSERGWGSTRLRAVFGMLVALAIIYAGGWSWLAILTGPRQALAVGIAPFLIADIVKVAIGAALLPELQKLVRRFA